jgi:hypothetical protein
MTLEIQVLAWDRHIDVVMLNRLIRSQPSPLDSCISITILYIYKKEKKKIKNLHRFSSTQKDHILSQK